MKKIKDNIIKVGSLESTFNLFKYGNGNGSGSGSGSDKYKHDKNVPKKMHNSEEISTYSLTPSSSFESSCSYSSYDSK